MQPPSPSTRLRIDFAQASDPGRDPNKQVNEDACGYADTRLGYLCVLCDGMGGHQGGKEASRTAITTIFQRFEQAAAYPSPIAVLKEAIEEAGRRVYALGGSPEHRTRPGSTVVAMLVHDRGVDVAHVGDSRAYVIRANQIYPLTRDHSMVQGMIDAGLLTEAQAIGHPDANKITRALGMKPDVDVEVRPEPMELFNGDILLQASDGLTDLALAPDILQCVQQNLGAGDLNKACQALVQMANDRGGHDNITVQMVRITDAGPKASLTIPQAPSAAIHSPHAATPLGLGQVLAAAGHPPPGAPAGARGVPETFPMTAPDGTPRFVASPEVHWAPVPPTAADAPPLSGRPGGGVSPTMPAGNQGAPVSAPIGRMDSAERARILTAPEHELQPPSSVRQGPSHWAAAGLPAGSLPPSGSYPDARPPRGGIVFVIVGLSAFVAVMIILLVWAVFLRG